MRSLVISPLIRQMYGFRMNQLIGASKAMKILWNNALEHGTASSLIAKGSPVYALEIGLRWD